MDSQKENWIKNLISTDEVTIRIGVQKADEEAKKITSKIANKAPLSIEESIILQKQYASRH